ncbi:hypothetical protein M5K25_019863 [Dendrobium thyrsiflorum]|uniref:Uncharacterized protein n=1 Tax=Dendrobium thyrsiflorum TaxID=117978 RepID=A0ABD0UG20_DENTH
MSQTLSSVLAARRAITYTQVRLKGVALGRYVKGYKRSLRTICILDTRMPSRHKADNKPDSLSGSSKVDKQAFCFTNQPSWIRKTLKNGKLHQFQRKAGSLVHFGDDRVADALEFLHLVIKLISLSQLITFKPLDSLINGIFNLLLVISSKLRGNLLILDGVPHIVRIILQCVLRLHLFLVLLVLRLVLFSFLNHLLNLLLAQTALVIGDGDLILLPSCFILSRNIQDTIGINVKANSNLGNTPGSRDGGVPWNQNCHDTTGSLQTKGERSNVKEEKVLNLLITFTAQDGSLNSSTISNCFIRVDALAELLPIEKVLQKLLHLRNPSGPSNQNNIMNSALVHLCIPQALLHRFHTLPEEIHVKFLKPGTSDCGVEINALIERINFNCGLSSGR